MTFSAAPEILRFLGKGKDKRVVLSALCLVFITFFYFFVIGSYLQFKVFTFQYRVTYENIFTSNIIDLKTDTFILFCATIAWLYISINDRTLKLSLMILFSVFLISLLFNLGGFAYAAILFSLPLVTGIIIVDKCMNRTLLRHHIKISLNYVTIATISLALVGIITLLFFLIGISNAGPEKFPYAIYQQLLSILAPLIMAVLIFCVPLKVILERLPGKMKAKKYALVTSEHKVNGTRIALCLLVITMFGVGVAFIPHLHVINPNNERLGVDTPRYVEWLSIMKNQTGNPIYFALKAPGDRPLSLILLFTVAEITKASPFLVAEYIPLLLTPLLIIVTFFLTRELTMNDGISLAASFLTAISFHTLTGIYSGFYANWLSLILGYLAFALTIRYLKKPTVFPMITLAIVMTGTLLAHVYTWTIMISVAFVFLFILRVLQYYPGKRILLLFLVLSSSIAIDVLKSSWTGSSTGLEADFSRGRQGLGISQFSERLATLADTVQTYYGGIYANITILGLVIYWLIRCQPRETANIFIMIFLSTALIPLFIGDWVLQSRVLYDIPFQIPAAISLYYIGRKNGNMISMALLLITIYLSLHVLANLGYVPPINPLSIIKE